MRTTDLLSFATRSLAGARTRTLLMLLAMSIGVASVVVLTALGEGARRYVVGERMEATGRVLIPLDRAEVEAWVEHLDTTGIPHGGIVDAPAGHVLVCRDPDGIPIVPEDEIVALIDGERVDEVVFSYSDVSHEQVMHLGSRSIAAGAGAAVALPLLEAMLPKARAADGKKSRYHLR